MEILLFILFILIIIFMLFIICSCIVSGECSKKEEQYRNLDPKVLDDDTKEWYIEDEYPYDETFVKKGTKCKKSNMK